MQTEADPSLRRRRRSSLSPHLLPRAMSFSAPLPIDAAGSSLTSSPSNSVSSLDSLTSLNDALPSAGEEDSQPASARMVRTPGVYEEDPALQRATEDYTQEAIRRYKGASLDDAGRVSRGTGADPFARFSPTQTVSAPTPRSSKHRHRSFFPYPSTSRINDASQCVVSHIAGDEGLGSARYR